MVLDQLKVVCWTCDKCLFLVGTIFEQIQHLRGSSWQGLWERQEGPSCCVCCATVLMKGGMWCWLSLEVVCWTCGKCSFMVGT